jgi:hypothetical protein
MGSVAGVDCDFRRSVGPLVGAIGMPRDVAVSSVGRQPAGGSMSTMLPHLGQARIWPMADASRTLRRAWQVVQSTVKSST